jgi:hypothetical protein
MKISKMLMLGALALTSVTDVYCSDTEVIQCSVNYGKGLIGEIKSNLYTGKMEDGEDVYQYRYEFLNSLNNETVFLGRMFSPTSDIALTTGGVIKNNITLTFPWSTIFEIFTESVDNGVISKIGEIARVVQGKDLNNYQVCARIVSAITGKNKLEFTHHRATGMEINMEKFAAEKKNNGSWIVNKI